MFSTIKNKLSLLISSVLIVVIIFIQYNNFDVQKSENPYPIAWDVYGYYLYLPATFIYNDLGLEKNEWQEATRNKYNPSPTFYQVAPGKNNKKVIIYNVGYAFIHAPGFLIAHWIAPKIGYDADGFSKPYQLALLITALIFTIIGIFLLRRIALLFFSDKITALLILIVLVGTNYFFQATFDGVMPHNILFTLNCCIIWFTIKWHENKKIKFILLLALFLGLACICRPTELIWILVPLFWNIWNIRSLVEKCQLFIKHYIQIISFCIILISIIFIQFFYLKYTTGYFKAINLHSEQFSFLEPYTFQFLFSYKKGWLLYTPIMILGIIGFYFLKKENKNIWLPFFLFFVINLYVVSSWECWWYAASYSQRPMIETYAMMIFPIGYFLTWTFKHKNKWVFSFILFASLSLITLNLFQTWQYKKGIIDPERMTKEYYWKVFGKTEVKENDKKFLSVDRYQDSFSDYENYTQKEIFYNSYETENNANIIDTTAVSGKKCLVVNSSMPFSQAFEKKYNELTEKSFIRIRASVWVYTTCSYNSSPFSLVISTESDGQPYKYMASNHNNDNIPLNTWTKIHVDYISPDIRHKSDIVKIYFWNNGGHPILIDDFKVEIFIPKIVYE